MSGPPVIYEFDDKYVADTDGFTFNFTAWLGPNDQFSQTPTATVITTGSGLPSVTGVAVNAGLVTVWLTGGSDAQTYTIEVEAKTVQGRDCRVRGTVTVVA